MENILQTLGPPSLTTISRAVESGFTPLKYRFIGEYVASVVAQNLDDIEHYRTLCDATEKLDQGESETAKSIVQRLMFNRPHCAATQWLGALTERESEQAEKMLNHVSSLDSKYAYNFSREVCGYPHRYRTIEPETIEFHRQKITNLTFSDQQNTRNDIALALTYAWAGMADKSWEILRQHLNDLENFVLAALSISQRLMRSEQPNQAEPLLQIAGAHEKTRAEALLCLGDLAMGNKQYSDARKFYARVVAICPAWILPKQRLATSLRALNNVADADALDSLVESCQQRMQSLIARE